MDDRRIAAPLMDDRRPDNPSFEARVRQNVDMSRVPCADCGELWREEMLDDCAEEGCAATELCPKCLPGHRCGGVTTDAEKEEER